MSFSKDIKLEILNNLSINKCCRQSFLSALIKCGAEYGLHGNDLQIYIKTQFTELCDVVKEIATTIFNVDVKVEKSDEYLFNNIRYDVVLSGKNVKKMLCDLDVAYIEDKEFHFYSDLHLQNLTQKCCIKEFIKASFLCCGSASGVDKNGTKSIDYHIEWVFPSEEKGTDFLHLLEQIEVFGRVVKRKKLFVTYLQKFETISDMLVLFDAQDNMLKLNNEFAKRSVMNNVNRQSNCDSANMSKTIDNSLTQLKAIELINDTIGLEALDEDLASICMLRLANVEESLQNLAKLAGMSKSAVNYRFNKILKIAKEIQEDQK